MTSSETSDETRSQLAGDPLLLQLRDDARDGLEVRVLVENDKLQPHRRGNDQIVRDGESLMLALRRQLTPDRADDRPHVIGYRHPWVRAADFVLYLGVALGIGDGERLNQHRLADREQSPLDEIVPTSVHLSADDPYQRARIDEIVHWSSSASRSK